MGSVGGMTEPKPLPPLPIRTERLVLRRFEASDLDAFHAYHSLPETARFLPREAKSYTKSMELVGRYANFEFEKEGDWIGSGRSRPRTRPGLLGEVVLKWLEGCGQAEIGWSLAPEARGTGHRERGRRRAAQARFRGPGLPPDRRQARCPEHGLGSAL